MLVDKRIEYKLLLYTYKALHDLAPEYLCELVVPYVRSRGIVASAPDFERADEGSILTAGLCFKSGKSECNNSGYKLTGLTWWP